MPIDVWVVLAALFGAVVLSGRSRTLRMAGCGLVLILVCYVVLVLLHALAR